MNEMRRISFRYLAPEGSRFAPGAFDRSVGKDVQMTVYLGDVRVGEGTLVAADVAEDGLSVWLTLDASSEVVG